MPERSDPKPERSDAKFEAGARNGTLPPLTPLRVFCAETPIIPAIRKPELVELAIASRSRLIYLLTGDPENVEQMIQKITAAGKVPIVNLDLLNGFSRDKYAVNYLKHCGVRGIISTHLDPLRHAHSIDLYAIQRTFLLDSGAKNTITNQLKNSPVDALEVLPAPVAPKLLDSVRAISPDIPVVGGGLIWTLKEAEDLLAQGLDAIQQTGGLGRGDRDALRLLVRRHPVRFPRFAAKLPAPSCATPVSFPQQGGARPARRRPMRHSTRHARRKSPALPLHGGD